MHWMVFFSIVIGLQCLTTWMIHPTVSADQLFDLILRNNGLFLISVVLLLPSFVFDSVKVSNRFAGPMIRLKNEFRQAAESGKPTEISFREGDFWAEMAEDYNRMIRKITSSETVTPSEPKTADSNSSAEKPAGHDPSQQVLVQTGTENE